MCGIVGYLGKNRDAYPILIKGLKRLEYRGYDSAGVALINEDGDLSVYKTKGKVADLEEFCADKDITGHIGIAHTRWRTVNLHLSMLTLIIHSRRTSPSSIMASLRTMQRLSITSWRRA